MLSTIDIYNAGAEDPVITHARRHDDALDVVRPKIFAPLDANMDRHQGIMAALELGQHPDLIGSAHQCQLSAYIFRAVSKERMDVKNRGCDI